MVIHYNSFGPGAEATREAVRAAGAEAISIQADLGTPDGIQACIGQLKAKAPAVDILINNAGSLVKRCALADYTEPLFDAVMNLNVKSAWFITQAVTPHMIAQGSGAVVFVSSIAARNGGGPGATIY